MNCKSQKNADRRLKLSDREVELMRQLHDEGMGWRELMEKFEVSRRHVFNIVGYHQRVSAH